MSCWWTLSNTFSLSTEIRTLLFSLIFIFLMNCIDFQMLNWLYIPGIDPTRLWCNLSYIAGFSNIFVWVSTYFCETLFWNFLVISLVLLSGPCSARGTIFETVFSRTWVYWHLDHERHSLQNCKECVYAICKFPSLRQFVIVAGRDIHNCVFI